MAVSKSFPGESSINPKRNSKHSVFLTRVLPAPVMTALQAAFSLRYHRPDGPISREALLRGVRSAEGLVCLLTDSIDAEVIAAAPHLKIIASYAVGFNNIDWVAASARGIAVTNTPGVLTETTADLAWALMLAVARRLPESERYLRNGAKRRWTGWAPTQYVGSDVYGKTLGIVGMGRIGQAVARRASGFAMRVVYFSRHRLAPEDEARMGIRLLPLPRLLRTSDYVTLHLPLTPKSHHLIDAQALLLMKPTAFLINTSRGPIVDEQALIAALAGKQLAGAGLDVYEREPVIPTQLAKMEQVVLLPHIGSASVSTRIRMGQMVMANLTAVFSGKKPPNGVSG